MELTKKDRLILINQYQILKRVDPDSAQQYERAIEILQKGYTLLYSEIAPALQESELCEEKARLVTDIIDAYKALEAYKTSNPGDKEIGEHPWATFRGFDGKTEPEYLDLARFLLQNGDLDSQTPSLPKYRMIALTWTGQGKPAEISRETALAMLGLGSGSVAEAQAEPEAQPEPQSEAPARSRRRSAAGAK